MTIGGASATPVRPAEVEPGTNVLIVGPALTRKREVMFDLVGGARGRAAIFVTTKEGAARVKAGFADGRDVEGWWLRYVDCVSRQRAVGPWLAVARRGYPAIGTNRNRR